MRIKILSNEPMTNVSYRLPQKLKNSLELIAASEDVSQGEIVRSFLEFAIDSYQTNGATRKWNDEMYRHFAKQAKVGDLVIASNIKGRIKSMDDLFVTLDIGDERTLDVLKNSITDICGPSEEVLAEMEAFQKSLKVPKIKKN